jgi:hypothetical protein
MKKNFTCFLSMKIATFYRCKKAIYLYLVEAVEKKVDFRTAFLKINATLYFSYCL